MTIQMRMPIVTIDHVMCAGVFRDLKFREFDNFYG